MHSTVCLVSVHQNWNSAHEALGLHFCEGEHFVEARFVVDVELVASQLNHIVIVFEHAQANWTVPALHELELSGITRLTALFNKCLESFSFSHHCDVLLNLFIALLVAVILIQEVSYLKRLVFSTICLFSISIWDL